MFGLHNILQQWDLIILVLKRKLHQNFLVLGLKLLGGILTERKGRLLCETGNKSRSSCFQATCDMTEPSPPSAVSSPTSVSPASNLVRFFLTLEPFHTWSPFTETIFFFSGYLFHTGCKLYLRRIYRKVKLCCLIFSLFIPINSDNSFCCFAHHGALICFLLKNSSFKDRDTYK